MYYMDHHFLDTNVIIGYTVEWDDHNNRCELYFSRTDSNNCSLFISSRVESEALSVVESCRRITLQAINSLWSEFQVGQIQTFETDVMSFIYSEFSDKKRFDALKRYIQCRMNTIREMKISNKSLSNILEIVRDDFEDPIQFLNSLEQGSEINIFTDVKKGYRSIYQTKFYKLDDIMDNKTDRDIALDAYHLLQQKDFNDLVLASLDSHFVEENNKSNIENCLNGICIFNLLDIET